MRSALPALTQQQQQQAADRIHTLISQGMRSGEAIARVAEEIRQTHTGEMIRVSFEDEESEADF